MDTDLNQNNLNSNGWNLNNLNLNKRLIFIIGGVVAILIIIGLFFALQQNSPQQTKKDTDSSTVTNNSSGSQSSNRPSEKISPTPAQEKPEQIALKFYNWYVSHPNPLGSRAYESLNYITEKYKKNLRLLVDDRSYVGYEVVFNCVGVEPPKKVIAQPPVTDALNGRTYVILQEDKPGALPLYQVDMHVVNGRLHINDIWCKL